jgi:sulfur carrier protein ThiS
MRVVVHLGEPFWRSVGQRELSVALHAGATVFDALASLAQQYPALAADLHNHEAQPALFMNDEAAVPESPLVDGAKLHIVWPVSGG